MITYVVQIGNSDNRLSQGDWSLFIEGLSNLLLNLKVQIHFFGFSSPVAPWQNCCAVFEDSQRLNEVTFVKDLEQRLADLAAMFGQESIALTGGITEFVEAGS